MVVPSFTDLGKNARDVFKTGYHYGKGLFNLNVKSKFYGNFELGSNLSLNFDASKLTGAMETKYKTEKYGTLVEKWTTDGTLLTGYELSEQLMKGVNVHSEFTYNPGTSIRVNDLNSNVNVLGSVVVAFRDVFIGYQGNYSSMTNKMTKNDIGLAFEYYNLGVHFRYVSIPHEYGCSLWYKVNTDCDAALNGILAKNGNVKEWILGAAAKYKIDEVSTLRFKFNTNLQLATSLQQKLNENIALTLSFNVDCANVTRGGHKVGLALNVEV